MSQKPVHKRNPLETREAVWDAIRKLQTFTVRQVREETRLHLSTVRTYLNGLVAAGYLSVDMGTKQSGAVSEAAVYSLFRDIGVEPPRVREDGSEITQGRGREQMWSTMRIIKEFSAMELAVNASTELVKVAEGEAKFYCKHLHYAGYLTISRPHRNSVGGGERYRFLGFMYTGPKPPMVQRIKQVYDANTRKVVWSEGVDHE